MPSYIADLHEVIKHGAVREVSPALQQLLYRQPRVCCHRDLLPFQRERESFQASNSLRPPRPDLFKRKIPQGLHHLTFTSPCNEFNPSFNTMILETCEEYLHRLCSRKLCRREDHVVSPEDLIFLDYFTSETLLCAVQRCDLPIDVRWEHRGGCIHSASADVTISHGENPSLATSLYFKQCDGTYVNALGGLKRMRYGERRVLGVDLLLKDELHKLFDIPHSWTDDLDGDELWSLFGQEQSGSTSWC